MFEYDEEARALDRGAPPVHGAEGRPREPDGHRPGRLHRQGLRHGAQRLGDRRRLGAYPPRRGAEQGVRRAEDRARGCQGEVRLPARRAAVRRAAARWHRVRPRPHRHDDDQGRLDPRRDRVPEDAARAVPAHRRTERGRRGAAARAAHPAAQPRQPPGGVRGAAVRWRPTREQDPGVGAGGDPHAGAATCC